ncbi:MAG: hypothetical protein ISR44_09195 [Rhodospirillales bacterium]|nr:hypothetical protein [Rhodospirillales bacterium]
MSKTKFHIGNIDDMGERFVDAWERAEAGDDVNERHVTFSSWEAMSKAMSGKRLEMLRHLRRHKERSIRSLSLHLKRDYRRVHEDVTILRNAGLISQVDLTVECEVIQTEINI